MVVMPALSISPVSQQGWTYRFEAPLGSGGFATVYRATMSSGEVVRRVAIKVLQLSAAVDAEAVARLKDEARILSRLEHPAVVKVLGTIEVQGCPAVVMDLVDGVDLRRLLKSAPLPARAVCEVGAEIAGALDAAWNDPDPQTGAPLRIIHRDIKPANVLLSRHGAVKLVDFGVARAAIQRDGTTRSVIQLGTERYMAPERFDHITTPASDIFALGISLIEMMVGRSATRLPVRPQQYEAAAQELLKAVWETGGAPHWTIELVALLEEMLRYDETRRPTARQVAERLLELSDEAPGQGLRRIGPALVRSALPLPAPMPAIEPDMGILDKSTAVSAPSVISAASQATGQTLPVAPQRRFPIGIAVGAGVLGLMLVVGTGAVGAWLMRPVPVPVVPERVVEPVPEATPIPEVVDEPAVETPRPSPPESKRAEPKAAPAPPEAPPPEPEAATYTVHFSVSAGAGGAVVVDQVRHPLPAAVPLSPGLHAATFEQDGQQKSQMVYVGEASPRRYVFDASSGVVHTFK